MELTLLISVFALFLSSVVQAEPAPAPAPQLGSALTGTLGSLLGPLSGGTPDSGEHASLSAADIAEGNGR